MILSELPMLSSTNSYDINCDMSFLYGLNVSWPFHCLCYFLCVLSLVEPVGSLSLTGSAIELFWTAKNNYPKNLCKLRMRVKDDFQGHWVQCIPVFGYFLQIASFCSKVVFLVLYWSRKEKVCACYCTLYNNNAVKVVEEIIFPKKYFLIFFCNLPRRKDQQDLNLFRGKVLE